MVKKMKLRLLRINEFIGKHKIQEVKSNKIYVGSNRNELHQEGIFSQEIFGRTGSIKRKKVFGYINLKTKLIHPECFKILTSINTDLTKLISGKENYIIDKEGNILPDEKGETGILFFINNFDNINFTNLKTNKPKYIDYILKYKEHVLIDKYLVIPAGTRDIQISSTGSNLIEHSEINDLYIKLINQVNMASSLELIDSGINVDLIKGIQKTLNAINDWFKNKIKGKYGIIRGGMLKKVVDYCARLVIVPDTKIELGYVGIPWHICLKLYEPMFIHHIIKKDTSDMLKTLIQQFFGLEKVEDVDIKNIKMFNNKINESPLEVNELTKREFIKVAEEVVKDKQVIYKRDPVENRDSWIASYVIVKDTGFVLSCNNFDLNKHTGDYDGDTAAVYSLLTNEAQKQAKEKLNPIHTKSIWTPVTNYDKVIYGLNMDAAIAIHTATLK
jgi:DNA-directed RNA polymerase beta' subunit